MHKAGAGAKKVERLNRVPDSKFKIGQKVTVDVTDDTGNTTVGFGRIKNREFIWHPEYWGGKETDDPYWGYSIETTDDSPEDVSGNWKERALDKFDKKDW